MPDHDDINEDPTRESYRLSAMPKHYVENVHRLFPHMRRVLDRALHDSEPFRDLVEEYGVCTEVLERQQFRTEPQAREYAALRLRLESEILQYLSDYVDSHDS
jgi:hypothetical protein